MRKYERQKNIHDAMNEYHADVLCTLGDSHAVSITTIRDKKPETVK
jgi:hypothetical protein